MIEGNYFRYYKMQFVLDDTCVEILKRHIAIPN